MIAAEQKATILLVDDQPANLLALEVVLDDLHQDLVKVNSGREALRYLFDHDVALILMDVQMPGMDGYETAELIHGRARSRYTPIIFLTGYDRSDAQLSKGYAVGAVDFLTKPFVPHVLKSKVAVFVDLFRKTEEVQRQSEILREIERKEHERQLAEVKHRLEAEKLQREMQLARDIQQRLFPESSLSVPGLDICGLCYPADATGGDYFDYITLRDKSLGFVIGDVSGHGIGAALLMSAIRAYLHALAMTYDDLETIISLTNRAFVADVGNGHFVTLLMANLDPRSGSLVYCSAGHPPGYVLNARGEVRLVLKSTGIPLGIVEAPFPMSPAFAMNSGDSLFLFTDGLIETAAPDGTLFQTERALSVIRENRHRASREIVNFVYEAARSFRQDRPQRDDMTLMIVKLTAPPLGS